MIRSRQQICTFTKKTLKIRKFSGANSDLFDISGKWEVDF